MDGWSNRIEWPNKSNGWICERMSSMIDNSWMID